MTYEVIGKEVLICRVEVDAKSRREAMKIAEDVMNNGTTWDSIGRKIVAKKLKEGGAE